MSEEWGPVRGGGNGGSEAPWEEPGVAPGRGDRLGMVRLRVRPEGPEVGVSEGGP